MSNWQHKYEHYKQQAHKLLFDNEHFEWVAMILLCAVLFCWPVSQPIDHIELVESIQAYKAEDYIADDREHWDGGILTFSCTSRNITVTDNTSQQYVILGSVDDISRQDQ